MKGSPISSVQKQAVQAGVKFFPAAGTALAVTLLVVATATVAQTRPGRDGVSDALAGHGAEMRQFGAIADPMRRPLFYDAVDLESVPAGVPCDHIVARRPETDGGRGWVVLMETVASPARRLRYWHPPHASGGEMEAVSEARHFAIETARTAEIRLIGVRSFVWCR